MKRAIQAATVGLSLAAGLACGSSISTAQENLASTAAASSPAKRIPWPMEITGVSQAFGSPQSDPRPGQPQAKYRPNPHYGIDLVGVDFAPVFAAEPGTVVLVLRDGQDSGALGRQTGGDPNRTYGRCLIRSAQCPEHVIQYLHLDPDSIAVRVDDVVAEGTFLGEIAPFDGGAQPDHLHIEVVERVGTRIRGLFSSPDPNLDGLKDPESIFEPLPDTERPLTTVVLRGTQDTVQLKRGEQAIVRGPRWVEIDVVECTGLPDPQPAMVLPPKQLRVVLDDHAGPATLYEYDLTGNDVDRATRLLTKRTKRTSRLSFALYPAPPGADPGVVPGAQPQPLAAGTYTVRASARDSIDWGPEFEATFTLSD